MTRFFIPETPRLFAHRGDNVRFPENTLPAFRSAADRGVRYLELDVWLSRDLQVVVHHDRTTARSSGRRVDIPAASLAELRRLDAGWGFVDPWGERPFAAQGVHIPLLEDVLDAFPEMYLTVEIKQDSRELLKRLLDTVRESGARDRVLLASHRDDVVRGVREMDPEIPTNFGYQEARELILRAEKGELTGYVPPASALQIPPRREGRRLISPKVIQAAHRLGVEIHVWTVNEEKSARGLLDLGVDGIMSDDSEMLAGLSRLAGEKVWERS